MSESPVHPDNDVLVAFGLGRLEPDEATSVETHLEQCSVCCETLLDLKEDTFVGLVRQAAEVDAAERTEGRIDDDSVAPTIVVPSARTAETAELPTELTEHPRYHIVELIGRGGMGDVYKAEHRLMNRTVALKVINGELVRNAPAVERFRREVQSAARLSHPNIVTAHDAEQAGDVHYLVMEYVDGRNLSDHVKQDGPLSVSQACDVIRQAAAGLQHAHEQGMVHRDIKPHNLMVTADGQVKILDFGLATLARAPGFAMPDAGDDPASGGRQSPDGWQGRSDDRASDGPGLPDGQNRPPGDAASESRHPIPDTRHLTTAGTMMGTPDFISPEQAGDARSVDIRSDIYSLGCTLFFLLTGRPPFDEGSVMDRVKAHAEYAAEPIENVRVDVPAELAEVIRRMMAKDPSERFQSPAELADMLAPFVDEHRTALTGSTPAAQSSRGAGWSGLDRFAIAVTLLTLFCVLFVTQGLFGLRELEFIWPVGLCIGWGFTAWLGGPLGRQSLKGWLAWGATSIALAGTIIYVQTDKGTLEIDAVDESVTVVISKATDVKVNDLGIGTHVFESKIVDTATGSSVRVLPSGEYVVELQGDDSQFVLSTNRFVLRRGDKIRVRVTLRPPEKGLAETPPVEGPAEFALKTRSGHYVSAVDGAELNAEATQIGPTERLVVEWLNPGQSRVQVKTPGGNYLHPAGGGGGIVKADRAEPAGSEIFDVEWVDRTDFKLRLRTREGFYLHPIAGGGSGVDAAIKDAGSSEVFTLVPLSGEPLRDGGAPSQRLVLPQTRRKLADLITAARLASTDEEWEAVLAEHVPILTMERMHGEASEQFGEAKMREGGLALVKLLIGLPDEVHDDLLQAGYVKWPFVSLDESRQQAVSSYLSRLQPLSRVLGFMEGSHHQVRQSLATGDVGFAILDFPDGQGQVISLFVLHEDLPTPRSFAVIRTALPDIQDRAVIRQHARFISRQLGDLEDKPYSTPLPARTTSAAVREEFDKLVAAARQASTDEQWDAVLEEHVPVLMHGEASEQFGEAEMARMHEGGLALVKLLTGLPDEVQDDLLQTGYLKWQFTRLDEPRQAAMRDFLSSILAASGKLGFPADLTEHVPKMLASSDVGFAIVNAPDGQGLVCYILMPTAPVPIMLPILGASDHEGSAFTKSVYKQLGELEDKPYSELPARFPMSAGSVNRKVLVLGIDGMRTDAFYKANTPHIDGLIETGVLSEHCDVLGPRDTGAEASNGAGWTSLLTGVWPDKHLVFDNDFSERRLDRYPTFLNRLEQVRGDAVTASIVGYSPLNGVLELDVDESYVETSDRDVADRAIELLKDDLSALFIQFDDVDGAGHSFGFHPDVDDYVACIETADAQIGRILKALSDRPSFFDEDWLVVVTSDHGGRGDDHIDGAVYPEIREVLLVASGLSDSRVRLDEPTFIADVAVTALVHLGVEVDANLDLDGQALQSLIPEAALSISRHRDVENLRDAEMQRFQGVWNFIRGEANGRPSTPRTLEIAANVWLLKDPQTGRTIERMTFDIDPTQEPKQITVTNAAFPEPIRGIYRIVGDELHVTAASMPGGARPGEFGEGGEGTFFVIMRREPPPDTKRMNMEAALTDAQERRDPSREIAFAVWESDGKAVLRFADWLLVFEGIDAATSLKGLGSFRVPDERYDDSRRTGGGVTFSTNESSLKLEIDDRITGGISTVSVNDFEFKMQGRAETLTFGGTSYTAGDDVQTLVIRADGTARLEASQPLPTNGPQVSYSIPQAVLEAYEQVASSVGSGSFLLWDADGNLGVLTRDWNLIFEGVPYLRRQTLRIGEAGSFHTPVSGTTRDVETSFSAGGDELVHQIVIRQDGEDRISIGGYRFRMEGAADKLIFRDDTYTAGDERQTVLIHEDGTTQLVNTGNLAEGKEQAAVAAAEEWLKLLDHQEFEKCYSTTSGWYKRMISRKSFDLTLDPLRETLGPVLIRVPQSANYTTSLHDRQPGEYVSAAFTTWFLNSLTVERITMEKDTDGQWRMCGYYIGTKTKEDRNGETTSPSN